MHSIEQLISEYEYLIKMAIYKLKIYRDFEDYLQTGRIALWQAAVDYDENKGEFGMFAYTRIRYALCRELTKSSKFNQFEVVVEDELLHFNLEQQELVHEEIERPEWFKHLKEEEQQLIHLMFFEGHTIKAIAQAYGYQFEALKRKRSRLLLKIRQLIEQNEKVNIH